MYRGNPDQDPVLARLSNISVGKPYDQPYDRYFSEFFHIRPSINRHIGRDQPIYKAFQQPTVRRRHPPFGLVKLPQLVPLLQQALRLVLVSVLQARRFREELQPWRRFHRAG
jgi:hypothetical protein